MEREAAGSPVLTMPVPPPVDPRVAVTLGSSEVSETLAQHLQNAGLSEILQFYAQEFYGIRQESGLVSAPLTEEVLTYTITRLDRMAGQACADARDATARAERAEQRVADLQERLTRSELLVKVLRDTLGQAGSSSSAGGNKRPRYD